MSYEEKDWLMRQIKQLAQGLGQMLGKESIKEIINLEAAAGETLSDEELDDVLLIIAAGEKAQLLGWNKMDWEKTLELTEERFRLLEKNFSLLEASERKRLQYFVETSDF